MKEGCRKDCTKGKHFQLEDKLFALKTSTEIIVICLSNKIDQAPQPQMKQMKDWKSSLVVTIIHGFNG
jgi:hypothetical protein